jgi:predicted transcriptional regulator
LQALISAGLWPAALSLQCGEGGCGPNTGEECRGLNGGKSWQNIFGEYVRTKVEPGVLTISKPKGMCNSMKTAISIPDDLFEALTRIAKERNTSRSKVLTEATREYIERRKNRRLLLALNNAYSGDENSEEKELRKRSKKYYRSKISEEKW